MSITPIGRVLASRRHCLAKPSPGACQLALRPQTAPTSPRLSLASSSSSIYGVSHRRAPRMHISSSSQDTVILLQPCVTTHSSRGPVQCTIRSASVSCPTPLTSTVLVLVRGPRLPHFTLARAPPPGLHDAHDTMNKRTIGLASCVHYSPRTHPATRLRPRRPIRSERRRGVRPVPELFLSPSCLSPTSVTTRHAFPLLPACPLSVSPGLAAVLALMRCCCFPPLPPPSLHPPRHEMIPLGTAP